MEGKSERKTGWRGKVRSSGCGDGRMAGKWMDLQPQMAPWICPPADTQTSSELWGCNSVWGRYTGRWGRLGELFGVCDLPRNPWWNSSPITHSCLFWIQFTRGLWCGSWAGVGSCALLLLGVNQIALANAKQGRFISQFPWILPGWGSGKAQSKLGCCYCNWISVCTSFRVIHQQERAMAWPLRWPWWAQEIFHLALPKGWELPAGSSQTEEEQNPTQSHQSCSRTWHLAQFHTCGPGP